MDGTVHGRTDEPSPAVEHFVVCIVFNLVAGALRQ